MTTTHNEIDKGPSLFNIGFWAVLASMTLTSGIWLGYTVDGTKGAVGFTLGFWAFVLLLEKAFDAVVARGNVRIALVQAKAREAQEREDNTGTWRDADDGREFRLRWSPREKSWYIAGWISDNWQIDDGEERWAWNEDALIRLVLAAEEDGLLASDDGPTWEVQSRLGLISRTRYAYQAQATGMRYKPGPY